ncbi:MAG: hypothetical protein QM765_31015 [Myxococcales bacterium]
MNLIQRLLVAAVALATLASCPVFQKCPDLCLCGDVYLKDGKVAANGPNRQETWPRGGACLDCTEVCSEAGYGGQPISCYQGDRECSMPTCTPQTSKWCVGDKVTWYDSCGAKGEVAEDCAGAPCEQIGGSAPPAARCCTPRASKRCSDDDKSLVWLDACGNPGATEACPAPKYCDAWTPEGVVCRCPNQWQGDACDGCPKGWDPAKNCGACAAHYDAETQCTTCAMGWSGTDCQTLDVAAATYTDAATGLMWERTEARTWTAWCSRARSPPSAPPRAPPSSRTGGCRPSTSCAASSAAA